MSVGALATAAVDVVANLDTFEPDLKRKLETAIRTVSKSVEKDFDKLGARAGNSFSDSLAKGISQDNSFQQAAERAGDSAGSALSRSLQRKASQGAGDSGGEAGGFFSRAFETAASKAIGGALLKTFAAGVGALITAATPLSTVIGGGAAAIIALTAALGQASGAAISLGGVLGALGLAVGTVKLGFSGMAEATKAQSKAYEELAATGKVSEKTQKDLDAALKNLAPSAAAVVKQLGLMRPAWEGLRRVVQGNLFAGVSTQLATLGKTFLPILRTQLGATATTLNGVGRQFLTFVSSAGRASQINTIFSGLNGILKTLLQPLTTLAGGFLDIFTASLPFAQQLATVLSRIGTNFGEWLSKAVAGGGFQQFMQTAMTLVGSLFRLLGNIGSIIGSVFAAGSATGGDLLSVLRDITGSLAEFLKSAEGKTALASFFGLVAQAGGILVGVFKTLSPLLQGIGGLFQALQGPLQILGGALSTVVGQLAVTLGGALANLGPTLGTLVTALAPVALVLGTTLVGALQAVLPSIFQLVTSFASLLPALTPLLAILSTALIDTLTQVSGTLVQIIPVLAQFIAALAVGLQPVLAAIQPVLAQLVTAFLGVVTAALPLLTALLPLIPALAQLGLAGTQLLLALAPLITTSLGSFAALLTSLVPVVLALVPPIIAVVNAMTVLSAGTTKVVGVLVGFAVQAIGAVNRFRAGFVSAILYVVQVVVAGVQSLASRSAALLSAWVSATKARIDQVVNFFRALPGQIVGALSSLGGQLLSIGRDAIQGFINGLQGGLDKVKGIAAQIAGAVTGPVGKLLKIGSPSKVMMQIGAWTAEGYAIGIDKLIPTVAKAASKLATTASKAVQRQVASLSRSGNRSAEIIGAAMDVLDTKIKSAGTRLADLAKQSGELAKQVASSIIQTGDVTKQQDTSFKGIVDGLRKAVNQAAAFNLVIAKLKSAGLGETALQQIIASGPETGVAVGQSILAAGKAGIEQINRLQISLNRAATQAGRTAAASLYGAGILAAKGLLAGLVQQRSALDAQMIRLGAVLAKSLARTLGVRKLPGLDIPGYARGTIATRPHLAVVGDGRTSEAIIPLDGSQRSADLMDQSGLTRQALSRAMGDRSVSGENGRTREVYMPVTVAGLTKEETIAIFRDFLQNTFGPRLGLNIAGGQV